MSICMGCGQSTSDKKRHTEFEKAAEIRIAQLESKLQAAEALAKAVEKEALMGKSAKTRLHQAWYAYRNAGDVR